MGENEGHTESASAEQQAAEFSENMIKVAEQSQRLVNDFLQQQAKDGGQIDTDPMNIGSAFMELTAKMMADPAKMAEAQMALWQDYMQLWQNAAKGMLGQGAEPVITPEKGDKRFRADDWENNQIFDFIKQTYLLTSRWVHNTVHDVDGLDDDTAQKVDFYTRQFTDAMAPTNFVATNPDVLRETMESKGENLVRGLQNMLDDLERGKGKLAIKMTDPEAFSVGENIAVSPGKVIWQSELIQLIQYEPSTPQVHKRPLLIVPPWINKFYILDLKPQNSFIKWSVEQGLTVFVISWVNPDQRLAEKTFEDYMVEGIYAALDGVKAACGEEEVNIIGYCLGGTLTGATLAHMAANDDHRIKSATFFTSLVDFTVSGELKIFIDDEQLAQLEQKMADQGGILDGAAMSSTFNLLRSNDLIWSFVINNYLMGKDPFPFDLLYWNSDSTRMPGAMHSFYLRNMYQKNLLSQPGGIEMCGTPIDLRAVDIPVHIISTKEDHIAPWKGTYVATQLYSGETTFTLAGSGHIAGIVNPPSVTKYGYWSNAENPPDPDDWFAGATQSEGSWWPQWGKWVAKQSGPKVKARTPGSKDAPVLEDAPGGYVKVRSDE
ncbi:MAG: class I poly(R)-hydroxyalkanoic acid synthase [Rhodospirillaceae bacterium]|jgi:polyhydroxyalkanoate synthase subunit PhaC|nr:class I poly(R)-hydroxyalkanoic acid synthase [Rhodospirillaceae bacterium]MBT4487463.1 class I poly(R)-hydroxyalkanoic acid synthase [Rhodospirillaceae bacterium]MBT5194055.1 class I poly(R)-hydroxyalkanoic acid synthase [Rhodospirillaceae bacterium]MBT5895742.1 class I poly(R)-hydroxyalkanoic acid synthase [Rhodospirillaceae bacterium]MBT6430395.1 class I poly(R)-hydroxyalkanoic acid synthase [Rhodospirillaceae bacterium]